MNHFQTILPMVRRLLSEPELSPPQTLLDHLLEEQLLSREYHNTLLQELDTEALARKISLTLLGKGDLDLALLEWAWNGWQTPVEESGPNDEDQTGTGPCTAMDLGSLEGGYLELLNSSADPLQLYHLCDHLDLAGDDIETCSEPDKDTISYEQFNRLFCAIEDDEETREAYNSIADLDYYIFQDSQLDGLSKDMFIKHIGLEELPGETVGAPEEAGQRSPKRPCPEEPLPADAKHRRLEPPVVPVASSTFQLGSVPESPALSRLVPPGLCGKEDKVVLVPMSPLSTSSGTCLSLPAGPLQIIPTLPQALWQISSDNTGLPSLLIYSSETLQMSNKLPVCSPAVQSLPEAPGQPGPTSPFAPSAADLPSMPEPALTSRENAAEDMVPHISNPEAPEGATKLPKWPEIVEQFQQSLRDKYQAEPLGSEGFLVEVDLVRAQLERSSSKSQEREPVILDWMKRQPAHGGLAQALLAAEDRRRPQDTRVLVVLGKAGQGKSLCVRAVTRAWACGQLPHYDFVFLLPGHGLERLGEACSLRDLLGLAAACPLDSEVFGHIMRQPHRVLFLLDTLEGLEAQDSLPHGAAGHDWAEPRCPRVLLAGLLQHKLLRGCTVVLTARPRGRLGLSLAKADALFEVTGFSDEQAQTYVRRYWEQAGKPELQDRALGLLCSHPFLLGQCHSPAVCQSVCHLLESLLGQTEEAKLPATLTELYVSLLGPVICNGPLGTLDEVAKLAWECGRQHRSSLAGQVASANVRAWAVASGLLQPIPGSGEDGLAFPSFLLQCFLAALWLSRTNEVKDKLLSQYLALTPRKKRPYDNWLEGVPRFLAGLLFQPATPGLRALATPARSRKQKVLSRYLKRLQPGLLPSGRLLELLHCAHEAQDPGIWQHALHGLPNRLCFLSTRLAPPDVHVLCQALQEAGPDFALDVRSTGINPAGLGHLVGLSCVSSFRAALSDTVSLCRSLHRQGHTELLQAVEDKFTIEPLKVESLKDVEDLSDLVKLQRTPGASGDACQTLPAVQGLRKLEFALGPTQGPQAFPRLVQILEAFSSLRHLDLDSLSENKIGDDGVVLLLATFPQLQALETLNLSQNSITDVGACKLAEALPTLAASLLRLSLYNNCICDKGAESLAHVLPEMGNLRELDVQYNKFTASGAQQLAASLKKSPHIKRMALWTPTIPFGVQEHLQQLDSRISLR